MIEIIKCMPGCTVQDAGRFGYRRLGVGSAGAMDGLALATGNILLGNDAHAAALEIIFFPLEIRFQEDCAFSFTGAGQAVLDGQALPGWWKGTARRGQLLRLESLGSGGIGYLCLAGGVAVETVLESASTDLKGVFGGVQGRMLKLGDVLAVHPRTVTVDAGDFGAVPYENGQGALRVLPGFEFAALPEAMQAQVFSSDWQISRQSNRIGFLLEGPRMKFDVPVELLSYGVLPGLIQLPPSGQPVVMLADAQTCGGYPRLGTLIDSDLRRLAQSAPGSSIQLRICTLEEAAEAEASERQYLARLSRMREVVCP